MSLDLFSIFPLTVGVRLNVLKSNRKEESEILICQSACSLRGGGAQVIDIPGVTREVNVVQFQESDGLGSVICDIFLYVCGYLPTGQSLYWRSNVEHRFLFGKGLKIHSSLPFCLKAG